MNWFRQHKKAAWFSLSAAATMLLLAGAVYSIHVRERGNKASTPRDGADAAKQPQSAPLRVKVIYPQEGGVERLVRRPATVQSFDFANLYAKVSGYLTNQKVDIGSKVKKDDVLAEVYAPEKYKDVEKASADLAKTRADYKAVGARVDKANADLKAARSQFERSKADVKKAQALVSLRRKIYQRYKGLAAEKAIQEELVDEKLEAQVVAEEQENAAEKAVDAARSAVMAAEAGVKQAEADLTDAEAAIASHGGELPMLAVARTDKMRIIVQVPDLAVPYLHEGAPADLKIDTLGDRHFKGKVARMTYLEVYDTRTMRTEVDMLNPDGLLKDGMYGEITIHLGREKGLRIPSKCLVGSEKEGDERSVFVVRDDRAREVKVKIGLDDGIEVTIRDGLSLSDQVVAERPPSLADGMQVEVIRSNNDKSK